MSDSGRERPRRLPSGWLLASLAASAYLFTSLVVVLNSVGNATGVVWLPSFPRWYYDASRVLYWPFQPYFQALAPLQANPSVSYAAYAAVSRLPFLVVPLALLAITGWKWGRSGRASADRPQRRNGGRRIGPRLALLVPLLVAAVLYATVPPVHQAVSAGMAALDPRDLSRLRDYLRSFGVWAPAVSFLLMVLQSVVAPLPAFVITLVNGLLFGVFWGTVLSWSSAMVGAALCFGIARALGRPFVERVAGPAPLAKTDAFFDRYGSHAVLIARLLPIISFDLVSYAAGLAGIRWARFLLATGLGQLPATVVYSALGEQLTTGPQIGLWAAGTLLSLLVVGLTLKARIQRQVHARQAFPPAGLSGAGTPRAASSASTSSTA